MSSDHCAGVHKMKYVLAIMISLIAVPSFGAVTFLETQIQRVYITDDSVFGGCMAKPKETIKRSLVNCKPGWVTFDCAGTLGGAKSMGQRKLDVATLAQLTGNRVSVLIDDSQTLNGYCLADRIQIFPN